MSYQSNLVEQWSFGKEDFLTSTNNLKGALLLKYRIGWVIWTIFDCIVVEQLHFGKKLNIDVENNCLVYAISGIKNHYIDELK